MRPAPPAPTRDVHSAFMSPVFPLKDSAGPAYSTTHWSALLLPAGSPVDAKLSSGAPGNSDRVVSSWSHLSESMLELDRALESPVFSSQSPALSQGVSPTSREPTPSPTKLKRNSSPLMFSRDRDSSLLKMILIPHEFSPKHVSFEFEYQKPADSKENHAFELPSLLLDQISSTNIRSSARSALSAFDSQAVPATLVLSTLPGDAQFQPALFREEHIRIQTGDLPNGQERVFSSETMCMSELGSNLVSGVQGRGTPVQAASSPKPQKQLIDPFMCVSSQGLIGVLVSAYQRRLVLSCLRNWQIFVAASGNAKVLKLEMRLEELQTSFSTLQQKYSLVCSSEFSKRISTEHLRWSATELSAGGTIATVSKSNGGSNPVVSRFERILFKAHMSLRVRTRLRCFHSWFMLAMRHRHLRACYNHVSGRRVRRLLSSVMFNWYRGAHIQSKARVLYSQQAAEENGDSRQLQLQLARQEKAVESLRETNRKLELDLRRMVPPQIQPLIRIAPTLTLIQKEFTSTKFASVAAQKKQYEDLLRSNQARQSQIDAVQFFLESKASRIHLVMQGAGKHGGIEAVVSDLLDIVKEIRISNRASVK